MVLASDGVPKAVRANAEGRLTNGQDAVTCYREPVPYFAGQPEELAKRLYDAHKYESELLNLGEVQDMTFYVGVQT